METNNTNANASPTNILLMIKNSWMAAACAFWKEKKKKRTNGFLLYIAFKYLSTNQTKFCTELYKL